MRKPPGRALPTGQAGREKPISPAATFATRLRLISLGHRQPSFSNHIASVDMILRSRFLRLIMVPVTLASPARAFLAATTTGHPIPILFQLAREKSHDHLVHLAANLRDDTDTGGSQRAFQGPGDRPANQHVDPQPLDPPGSAQGIFLLQGNTLPTGYLTAIHIDQKQGPRDVEHRRDPVLPVWDRDSHFNPYWRISCATRPPHHKPSGFNSMKSIRADQP
ncbi:MAG: hypothetical protein PWP23_2735 [Candidatus Sumerlaeota bacterium]|nr:hypothetical protein [Candidatus Sumerlaeota bacterium]